MTFAFSESLIEDYARDGYAVLRQILPTSLIADLRRAAERGRILARQTGGRLAQRFEPIAQWDIDRQPFADYRDLPELRDAVCRLLSPRHTYGNPEIYLGVLIEPQDLPHCVAWHQDWRHFFPASRPFLTADVKRDPDLFNQINCALYQDDCTWVVPGSHARDDSPAEREAFPDDTPRPPRLDDKSSEERERICLDYCRSMPGARRLHLDPGDLCIYRNTLWHTASYVPYVKRATILDVLDTPAYFAWRRSFGFDEEAMMQPTTRSTALPSAAIGSMHPDAGERPRGGDADLGRDRIGAPPDAPVVSPSGAPQATQLPLQVHNLIARLIRQETSGAWTLQASSRHTDWVRLRIQSGDQGVVDVEMGRADGPDVAAFRILDGVAFRYLDNGYAMSKSDLRHLDAVARTLRREAIPLTEQCD